MLNVAFHNATSATVATRKDADFSVCYLRCEYGDEFPLYFRREGHAAYAQIIAKAVNGIDAETLADLIYEGMDSVHDMDVTFRDYAKAAAENVLKRLGEPA